MKLPIWLVSLLLLGWTVWSTKLYWCDKCGCCGTPAVTAPATSATEPLLFKKGDASAITGATFGEFQADILRRGGLADTLVITGLYRKSETNTSKFATLGLARAEAAKELFTSKLSASRIRTADKLVDEDAKAPDMSQSVTFDWLKAKIDMSKSTIVENADNSVAILFPYNSSVKDVSDAVDAYLKTFAAKHKSDNTSFTITGYTDSKGSDTYNLDLGQKRADAIKGVLAGYGIAADRVSTTSKGKADPVASNETEEGRHQNRRVVIQTK
jgi:OmpA-OmpF porin, OOP family